MTIIFMSTDFTERPLCARPWGCLQVGPFKPQPILERRVSSLCTTDRRPRPRHEALSWSPRGKFSAPSGQAFSE